MPQHDIRVSKGVDETSRRRPSIELSPSLEKPVYIITRNLNGPHILHLIEELEKNHILYQMQQETNTLGFSLNQRFFVIVDNRYGQVTLGPEFGSILMTIVGYPRVGKNKKNRYYENPADIIKFFEEFKKNQDISKQTASLIQQQCSDLILEIPGSPSALKNRIQVKSICKYSKDPLTTTQHLLPLKIEKPVKLIIFIDKEDKQYLKICENLLILTVNSFVEEANGMDQIRRKTMFHTDKVKIYYLVNEVNSKELIKTIFLGQVIIYSTRQNKASLERMVDEPKIYGVAYENIELLKMCDKIGVKISSQRNISRSKPPIKKSSQQRVQKSEVEKKEVPQEEALSVNLVTNEEKDNNSLLKNESNIRDKPLEISKIDNCSLVSQPSPHEVSDLNASIISQASSGSRKIKRLKGVKDKHKAVIKDEQSLSKNKQVALERQVKQDILKQESNLNRKKTLKKEESSITSKSKKNLTFKQNLVIHSETDKRKFIKSVPKVLPEEISVQTANKQTFIQSEYYATGTPFKENRSSLNSALKPVYQPQSFITANHTIHGLFYRQFVPKLKKMTNLLAEQIQTNRGPTTCQSFLYMHEYDRHVRRLKNKMKEKGKDSLIYNFVVMIPQEEEQKFLTYCRQKNNGYDQEEGMDYNHDFNSTNSSYSQMGSNQFAINVFLLIDGKIEGKSETIDFNRIKVHKSWLKNEEDESNIQKQLVKELQMRGLQMRIDHLHS